MSKVLGFSIEIQGEQAAIEKAADVRLAISQINKALKETTDSNEYDKLEKELIRLKGTLKEVNAEQRQAVNEFTATAEGVGAYRQLSAQLNVTRQRFKDLAAAGQEYSNEAQEALKETKRLDEELKRIDASAGQFQRNVGNYPTTVTAVLEAQIPLLGQIGSGFSDVGNIASRTGRLIARSFIVFGLITELVKGIDALGEFSKEFVEFRRQANAATGEVGQGLDELVVKTKSAADVFRVDYVELLRAAQTASVGFGTSATESIDSITEALFRVSDQTGFVGELNSELSKLTHLGIDQDSALSLLVQASNNNFNIDVIAEPLIRIRERTQATRDAIEGALGTEAAEELFRDFEKRPIEAIQTISRELNKLDINSKEAGALLADVFSSSGEDNVQAARSLGDLNLQLIETTDQTESYSLRQREVLAATQELIAAQNELTKATQTFSAANETLGIRIKTAFLNIGANAIKGFQETLAGLSGGFQFFEGRLRQFALNAEKLNPFGRTSEEIDKDIKSINADFEELSRGGVDSIFDAIRVGSRARRIETDQLSKELEQEEQNRQRKEAESKKTQAEKDAKEQAQKEAQALAKARKKEQEKVLEQDRRDNEARIKLLNQLNLQLIEAQIDLIEDNRAREVAQREQDFEVRRQVLVEQRDAQIEIALEREQEILTAFGESSQQYLEFLKRRGSQELELQQQTDDLIVKLYADKERDIAEINRNARESEQRETLEGYKERIKELRDSFDTEFLVAENAYLRGLDSEAGYQEKLIEIRKAATRDEIEEVDAQIFTAELQGLPESDIAALKKQRQELENDLLAITREGVDNRIQEQQREAEEQQRKVEESLEYASQSLDLLDDLAGNIAERQNQRYQEQIEAQQGLVSNLEEEFQNAVGAKRVQLKEELDAEREALEASVEAQEQAQRQAAKTEKAIAVIQSVIQTALAVSRALSNPPGPPFSTPQAIAAGVFGAAQTAIIAAQPFAEGGAVTPVQLADGKIIATKNIPTMNNGDNVLATVKTGEVILNEQHVNMLGTDVLRAIGVPGFNNGGIAKRLAEPISPPIMPLLNMRSMSDIGETINAINRKTDAINARVDRLRAFVVSEDIEKDFKDKDDNLNLRTL